METQPIILHILLYQTLKDSLTQVALLTSDLQVSVLITGEGGHLLYVLVYTDVPLDWVGFLSCQIGGIDDDFSNTECFVC